METADAFPKSGALFRFSGPFLADVPHTLDIDRAVQTDTSAQGPRTRWPCSGPTWVQSFGEAISKEATFHIQNPVRPQFGDCRDLEGSHR